MEEKKTFLYFYWLREAQAKKHFFSQVKFSDMQIKMQARQELFLCRIPEFYMGKHRWEQEKLLVLLQEKLEAQAAEDYYMEPVLGRFLAIRPKLPPLSLLKLLLRQVPCWETLFWVGAGRKDCSFEGEIEEQIELLLELITEYLPRINHFVLVTEKPERYGDLMEHLYQEYGTPAAIVRDFEKYSGKEKKTVILDSRREYRLPYRMIPEEAFYIDLWSEEEKRYLVETKRRDVRYLSIVKFLDTIAKNGYNTIVNQTYN